MLRTITGHERDEILRHLKLKWASVNTAYQKMTFTLDTPAKQVSHPPISGFLLMPYRISRAAPRVRPHMRPPTSSILTSISPPSSVLTSVPSSSVPPRNSTVPHRKAFCLLLCLQKRKEQYEAELSEIERDIRMLEKGDTILVVED